VTVIYQLLASGIGKFLQQVGVAASLGSHTMAATWLAVAFSVGSGLFWAIEICCCCI
jgi:hypothetical protein